MTLRQELLDLDESLKKLINTVRESWAAQQQRIVSNPGIYQERSVPAEEALDSLGRPILADLIIARANLMAALANLPEEKT